MTARHGLCCAVTVRVSTAWRHRLGRQGGAEQPQHEIRFIGGSAIVHARTVYETSDGGSGGGRCTDIWHEHDGRWLGVAAHVTRLVG